MIHPSIGELTNNNKINRYTLVVATAKCARIITDEYVKQKEYAEKLSLSKDADKKGAIANLIKKEYRDEKAVKNAITGLYNGEFRITESDGTVQVLGHHREEGEEEKSAAQEKIDNYALDPNVPCRKPEAAAEKNED